MSTQPTVEDISAIVNRFQTWAGTQTAQAPAKPAVREVSYEDALRASGRPMRTEVSQEAAAQNTPKDREAEKPEKSAFLQVLKEQAAILPALARRSTTLSVRLTPEEQALLRARAAEASLSVSAYARQCVLEVEELREQVTRLLAREQKPDHERTLASIGQFMRRLFRGSSLSVSA